jgi:hypothetical protein
MILGCSNSEENTTVEAPKEKKTIEKKVTIEKKATIEETVLQEMGFNLEDEKIIIDFNKTNNFFLNIEKRLEQKAEEIETKIQNAEINITKGVEITDEKVSIDLNSTKNVLNELSELFQDIILDIIRTIN